MAESLHKEDPGLFSSLSAGNLGGAPWNPSPIQSFMVLVIYCIHPICCFPLSSCLTSQCSRKRFRSVQNSSQLTPCWKKLCTITFCLASYSKDFRSETGLHFKILIFKKLLLLSVIFLAQLVIKLQNANVFCRLLCLWLRGSTERLAFRVPHLLWHSLISSDVISFNIHKWIFFCYWKMELNR